jgi:hypothetical protein
MKTAEQFLEECKAKWGLNIPENAKQAMIEALILYAEQAIDEFRDKVIQALVDYQELLIDRLTSEINNLI